MISVHEIQTALVQATEDILTSTEYESPTLATFYAPQSHIKALRLYTQLVVGARGVGKTFWSEALQNKEVRGVLGKRLPELENVYVVVGYSTQNSPSYPSLDVFSSLIKKYEPESIWRGVLLYCIIYNNLCTTIYEQILHIESWDERIAWVAQHPEKVDRIFYNANQELLTKEKKLLVIFDALDRVAKTWDDIDQITDGLLRTALQFSTYTNIKTKIFLREDHCNRLSFSFPDSSKLLSSKIALEWTRADLYGLLWKRLCNGKRKSGEILRDIFCTVIPHGLEENSSVWLFDEYLRLNDDILRPLFHKLTGPLMGKDKRRGVPYVWTVSHLADTLQQTSPRSFLAAIRSACADSLQRYPDHTFPIHYESIKRGVLSASDIRVNEMGEDHPWARNLLQALRGMNVPCLFTDVESKWRALYPDGPMTLEQYPQHMTATLSPKSWTIIRDQLAKLGFCVTLNDGRFNIPDLYRVGFRLGRRGGVKPLP